MPRAPWSSFCKKARIQPLLLFLKSSSHKQTLVGSLAFSHFSTEQGGGGREGAVEKDKKENCSISNATGSIHRPLMLFPMRTKAIPRDPDARVFCPCPSQTNILLRDIFHLAWYLSVTNKHPQQI